MNRNIEFTSTLGKITLTKPKFWVLKQFSKILENLNVDQTNFIKHVLYYSQIDSNNRNYSLEEISNVDSTEINLIFVKFINADDLLLKVFNEGLKVNNPDEANKILRKYLERMGIDMAFMLSGVFLSVSIAGNWINALQGKLDDESNNTLSTISSIFSKLSESECRTNRRIKHILDDLKNFNNFQKDYIELCQRINRIIERVHHSEIWIPSRYSKQIINEFMSLDFSKIEKQKIETLILKHLDSDINSKIFEDWKNSALFKRREDILRQAFKTHCLELFAPSITCFLTQLDFVILEVAKSLNIDKGSRFASDKMLQRICNYLEEKITWDKEITSFFPEENDLTDVIQIFQTKSFIEYLRDITFADTNELKDHQLSRHGILHGKFLNYPSAINSKKLILLIDDLNTLYQKLQK